MLTAEEASRFLGRNGWLAQTSPAFSELVLARSVLRTYDRNLDLYHFGDEPGGLWGLADGAVMAEAPGLDGSPTLIHFARPGFWIGEASVITGGNRVVGLRTARPSALLRLSRSAFLDIAAIDPQAWRWLALLTLDHSITLIQYNLELRLTSSRRKIAAILFRVAGPEQGLLQALNSPIDIVISQEQLADFCGISRAAVAEVLRELAASGVIELGYRRIAITDVKALQKIGSGTA